MDGVEEGFAGSITRAREGDPVAWSDLYHGVAPLVIGYLRAQRLPDPEDVAGEVMLEVVRGIDRFQGDAAGFRSWVLTIAHHRLLDSRRRETRRPSTPRAPDDLDAPTATDDVEAEVLAELGFGRLEPALAALTAEQRNVMLLRVIGDLSVADVARILDKRPGAVKQLQRRATAAMRRYLDAHRADEAGDGMSPSPGLDDAGRAPAARERPDARASGRHLPASDERTGRDVAPSGDASSARWST